MVEQWSSKSHVWVRFLLPLLQKYRFQKRKFKPIKIFNKKKSKIINLNRKYFLKNFKFFNKKNFLILNNFYFFKNFLYKNFNFNFKN